MTASIRNPTAATLALVLSALALAAPSAAGAQEYVPFVTDFPRSGAATEYVPFVTDFGREPRAAGRPVVVNAPAADGPVAAPASRNWGDLALGSALGFALATLLAAAAAGVRRLRGHGPAGIGAEAH